MRSNRKSNPHRVLVALGNGPGSGFGLDFLTLLGKTGFALYPLLWDAGKDWIGHSAIQSLTRQGIFYADQPPPSWVLGVDSFDLGLVFGYPPAELTCLRHFHGLDLLSRCRQRLYLIDADTAAAIGTTDEIRALPGNSGDRREFFERLFAEITATLHHRRHLDRRSFALFTSIPPLFAAGFSLDPTFGFQLSRALGMSGLSPLAGPDAVPDLAIELYPGPFPVTRDHSRSAEVSFAPADGPLPAANASLRVRFLHPSLDEAVVRGAVEPSTLIAVRETAGDIVLYAGATRRVIPQLPRRPAVEKFAELLVSFLRSR